MKMETNIENVEIDSYNMYERAKEIQDLCDSDFASDKQLKVISEKFYIDFGCHWTEILNN